MEKFSTFKQDELVFVLHKIYLQTAKILETDAIVHARAEKDRPLCNFEIFDIIVKNSNIIVENILKLLPEGESLNYPRFEKEILIKNAKAFLESGLY